MSTTERFFNLFASLPRAHGQFTVMGKDAKGKVQGKAVTIAKPPTADLWELHLRGKQGVGLIPIRDDSSCRWGAIDIDEYPLDLDRVYNKFTELKLPFTMCRTKSGGAHLYAFFSEDVPAVDVKGRLDEFAAVLGYPGCEVFPKQISLSSDKDVGNWINMPYFGDTRYAVEAGRNLTQEQFLDLAEGRAITREQLLGIELPVDVELVDAPPCLQALAQRGFPPGTRNNCLFNLGVYARLRYGDEYEPYLDKFNANLMAEPLGHNEVATLVKQVNKKDYFYTCDRSPLSDHCNKSLCKNRQFGLCVNGGTMALLPEGLMKLMYTPPKWVVLVDGVNIEIDTDTLLQQPKFMKVMVERLNRFPSPVRPKVWRQHIDGILQKVEEVEVPQEASDFGVFTYKLEEFCTLKNKRAQTRDEITLGKVWVDARSGRCFFRGPDLLSYLDKQHFRAPATTVWSWMRELGASHGVKQVRGKSTKLWSVPTPEEHTQGYPVIEPEKEDF